MNLSALFLCGKLGLKAVCVGCEPNVVESETRSLA